MTFCDLLLNSACNKHKFCVKFTPYKINHTDIYVQSSNRLFFIAELSMYAVFQSGGKQHRVSEGQVVRLEKIEVETGAEVVFDKVLMVANGEDIKVGAPFVEGATIKAEIVEHGRGDKVKIVKFRRRKHYRKQQGHRQWFTDVKITAIA